MHARSLIIALLSLPLMAGQWTRGGEIVRLNDDGGWCWFEDERALIDGDRLILGTIASGRLDPTRHGNVEVTSHDLATGRLDRAVLHERFSLDDHNSPALWLRPDGHILAMYAKHAADSRIHYRITTHPHDTTAWESEQVFEPSGSSRVTYSNLHWLADENGGNGRVLDFFRGLDGRNKPSLMSSDDMGRTWQPRGVLIDVPGRFAHRPYVKYASNGRDAVHLIFTDGHPRDFDNSLYHAVYREGRLERSDGTVIRAVKDGPIEPKQATRLFAGDPQNVAWSWDVHLDGSGHPRAVFSVQKNSGGLPPGKGGEDHRYHYAQWDGRAWREQEIAHAGHRLYAGEDDYTGGIAIDPQHPDTVYISTSVEPLTGKPLPGGHFEIFQGCRAPDGTVWSWLPVTVNSTRDNLRPTVPIGRSVLLWLRGTLRSFTDFDLEVVALRDPDSRASTVSATPGR